MRLHVFLLAALLGVSPAMAETPSPVGPPAGTPFGTPSGPPLDPDMAQGQTTSSAMPPQGAGSRATPAAPLPKVVTPSRVRLTMEQRFDLANTSRDGRLTLDQAKTGYKTVARNFELIDTSGKGFVTLEDIRAWRKATRLLRQAQRSAQNDPLRPRQALQRTPSEIPVHEAAEPQAADAAAPSDRR